MQAVEFNTKIENQMIKIPEKFNALIQKNKDIKVIVLFDKDKKNTNDFMSLSKEQFLSGYSDSDSIYDK